MRRTGRTLDRGGVRSVGAVQTCGWMDAWMSYSMNTCIRYLYLIFTYIDDEIRYFLEHTT